MKRYHAELAFQSSFSSRVNRFHTYSDVSYRSFITEAKTVTRQTSTWFISYYAARLQQKLYHQEIR